MCRERNEREMARQVVRDGETKAKREGERWCAEDGREERPEQEAMGRESGRDLGREGRVWDL